MVTAKHSIVAIVQNAFNGEKSKFFIIIEKIALPTAEEPSSNEPCNAEAIPLY